jgi:hypothetical protein
MSEDGEIHAERLKSSTDLRSEAGPLRAANEGLFASKIPVVGSSRVSLIVCGVALLVVLALVIYAVVVRGQGTKSGASGSVRLECLIARLQNRPHTQDPAGDPCVR